MRLTVVSVLLLCGICVAVEKKAQKTRSVDITAAEERTRDTAGYAAIADIHREMDDDQSGSIDRAESTGFMTEDMNMRGSDARKREKAFHGEDDAITIDDLWEAWFESEERAWTNEQVIHWMSTVVNLPQYAGVAASLRLDGRYLPRLAAHNSSFITEKMGIKSSVHRQKLRLNALDVVLFGYRDQNSRGKDIALALLLLLFTTLLIVFVLHRRRARSQLTELNQRLTQLKAMETEFEDVQKKFDDERKKRASTADGGAHQVEMNLLREQLDEAHKKLGNMEVSNSATPLALQPLLRQTCELEMSIIEKEKQVCIEEMKAAVEVINNVAKRQGSLLNSLKLATGANTGADKVDSQIYFIKQRMERVQATSREMQERWMQIESLCGFPILYMNEGSISSRISSSQPASQFYRGSGSSTGSAKSLANNPHVVRHNVPKPVATVAGVSGRTGSSTVTAASTRRLAYRCSAGSWVTTTQPPTFYAQPPLHKEGAAYESSHSLLDSASMIAPPSLLSSGKESVKEEKKKRKFLGLFKRTSSKNMSLNSNGSQG